MKTFSKILRLERVLLEKNTKCFESDMKNYKKYNDSIKRNLQNKGLTLTVHSRVQLRN